MAADDPAPESPIAGMAYQTQFTLYNLSGTRAAEVRLFANGEIYLLESELIDGGFQERHSGSMVGPFESPEAAEHFIIATAWFNEQGI